MKTKSHSLQQYIYALATGSLMALTPIANASAAEDAARYVLLLIDYIMNIFLYAGIVLLVWSIIALILSLKNEDADSKVQAISQIAVAIVCITLSGTIDALMIAAGVPT